MFLVYPAAMCTANSAMCSACSAPAPRIAAGLLTGCVSVCACVRAAAGGRRGGGGLRGDAAVEPVPRPGGGALVPVKQTNQICSRDRVGPRGRISAAGAKSRARSGSALVKPADEPEMQPRPGGALRTLGFRACEFGGHAGNAATAKWRALSYPLGFSAREFGGHARNAAAAGWRARGGRGGSKFGGGFVFAGGVGFPRRIRSWERRRARGGGGRQVMATTRDATDGPRGPVFRREASAPAAFPSRRPPSPPPTTAHPLGRDCAAPRLPGFGSQFSISAALSPAQNARLLTGSPPRLRRR